MTARKATAGCLGDFLLWWVIVPCAGAFVLVLVLEPNVFSGFDGALVLGILLVLAVAGFVVLLTATLAQLRAKQAAIERELREEDDSSVEGR